MNNRILKFRFWSKNQKKFVYPFIWVQSNNSLSANDGDGEDIIIQQFTGLQDRNKKDICEGDIIKVSNSAPNRGGRDGIYLVEYYNGSFWAGGLNCISCFILRGQIFEIIGNILENSELLNNNKNKKCK